MTSKELVNLMRSAVNKGLGLKSFDFIATGVLSGTPVNAVAAANVLTVSGTPADIDTVSVAGTTYKWKTSLEAGALQVNEVLIGGSAANAIANLVLAINGGSGAGTNYGTGTVANGYVTAVGTATTLTVASIQKGVLGNSLVIGEVSTNSTWASGAVLLVGGVNGTVASAQTKYVDATYLWLAIADNTIGDANWIKFAKA